VARATAPAEYRGEMTVTTAIIAFRHTGIFRIVGHDYGY
jgi:hypothetical protein